MAGSFFSQLRALHERLTLNQKLSIAGLATVILFGSLAFVYLLHQDSYQLLFTDLDAAGASSVVEKLKQMDIPYRLSDGGRSVSVPADRVTQARIEIASQGLPASGQMGFELFDRNNWGITDFAEKVNYRRALSGELERTISGLSEVSHARVHLVMEKDSLFEDEKQPAKASVVVRLHMGRSLAMRQIAGIRNLVACSVEGLQADNVSVIDIDGNLLTQEAEDQASLDDKHVEARRKQERELVRKVVDILEPIVGKEKVRVTASVDLDHSDTKQQEEIYDPAKSVVLSQTKTEELVGGAAAPQGVPFRANESPAAGSVSTQNTGRDRRLQSEVVNYEVTKTLRQTHVAQGRLQRLSVSVVVDDKTVVETVQPDEAAQADTQNNRRRSPNTPPPEPQEVVKRVSRSPEEMAQLTELVKGAIGLDEARGDSLVVQNISFADVPEPLPPVEPGWLEKYREYGQPLARYLLIFFLFGLFYLMIFRPVKKRVFSYVEVSEADLGELSGGDRARLEKGEAAKKLLEASIPEELDVRTVKKKKLAELAKEDPALVTQIVRSWLSEGV